MFRSHVPPPDLPNGQPAQWPAGSGGPINSFDELMRLRAGRTGNQMALQRLYQYINTHRQDIPDYQWAFINQRAAQLRNAVYRNRNRNSVGTMRDMPPTGNHVPRGQSDMFRGTTF